MKICIINTLFPPNIVGGAEKSVSLLAAAFVEKGHSVSVISLHEAPDEKVEDYKGVRAYYMPLDNLYWPYHTSLKPSALQRLLWHINDIWNGKAAARIARVLDIEKPDIVHTNNLTGFSVAVWHEAKKRSIKTVHTLRDYSLICPRAALFNKGKLCEKRCAPCVALSAPKTSATKWVDHVIGISRYTLNEHLKRGCFKHAKSDVIFNIADVKPSAVRPVQKKAGDDIAFGFIGRVEDEKGIHIVLKACEMIPKTGWRLYVAGAGREDYVAALKEKHTALPVTWLGFVDSDVFFSKIDVLVVPSIWPEPLSRVIIEAAARGIPVIASDAGGQPELLNLGMYGIVYPHLDVMALAGHMQDVLDGKSKLCALPTLPDQDWSNVFTADVIATRCLATYQG